MTRWLLTDLLLYIAGIGNWLAIILIFNKIVADYKKHPFYGMGRSESSIIIGTLKDELVILGIVTVLIPCFLLFLLTPIGESNNKILFWFPAVLFSYVALRGYWLIYKIGKKQLYFLNSQTINYLREHGECTWVGS